MRRPWPLPAGAWSLTALAALLLALPRPAGAQEDCEFLDGTVEVSGDVGVTYIGTPRLLCRGGMRVRADSAVVYESARLYQLFGRAFFENAEIRLEAREAQYFAGQGRITAEGGVSLLRKEDGTSITGAERLEYREPGGMNFEEYLEVSGGRPRAVLRPRATGGAAPDTAQPYQVDADRIVVRGQNFDAWGDVEIRRGELEGFGDEVQYLGGPGQLLLRGDARLNAESYDASGGMILLQMPDDEIREVLVQERGVLVGEGLDLRAARIQLELNDGAIERLVASSGPGGAQAPGARPPEAGPEGEEAHPSRPVARAPEFTITGDSLEITAPGDVLESVLAIGSAVVISLAADSLLTDDTPEVLREGDLIRGDTVLAVFQPVEPCPEDPAPAEPGDTLPVPAGGAGACGDNQLQFLLARVGASALYRMPAADTTPRPPSAGSPGGSRPLAVHYVVADSITIEFLDGRMESMEAVGNVNAWHLEPPGGAGGTGGATGGGAPEPPSPEASRPEVSRPEAYRPEPPRPEAPEREPVPPDPSGRGTARPESPRPEPALRDPARLGEPGSR